MLNNTPSVSVVMPTFNRLFTLQKTINALEKQTCTYDEFEVIIVSDGSTDGTNDFLARYDNGLRLRPIFQHNAGPGSARNYGVQQSKGDLIIFLDDDVVPAPNLIAEHLKAHCKHQSERVVVVGPMLSPENFDLAPWSKWMQERLLEQYQAMVQKEWEPTARQFYTGNTSLSRRLFLDFGGFDANFLRAEDVELAYRMANHGVRFLFHPQAAGFHYEQRSFSSWLNIAYSYGQNDVIFHQQKGQDWLLPLVFTEFNNRHPFIRLLISVCLDRKLLMQAVTQIGRRFVSVGENIMQGALSRVGCSILFNLYYYQGVADQLGGRVRFFSYLLER